MTDNKDKMDKMIEDLTLLLLYLTSQSVSLTNEGISAARNLESNYPHSEINK